MYRVNNNNNEVYFFKRLIKLFITIISKRTTCTLVIVHTGIVTVAGMTHVSRILSEVVRFTFLTFSSGCEVTTVLTVTSRPGQVVQSLIEVTQVTASVTVTLCKY